MSTIQEKLAKLGEAMARARLEQRLGCRVVRRDDGEGGERYQVQFVNPDGTTKAVQPTAEWTYKIQEVLFDLANEMASALADMASSFEIQRARADVATAHGETAFAKGYEDGLVDGGIKTQTDLIEKLQKAKAEVEGLKDEEWKKMLPRKSCLDALDAELRRLDQLAVDFADGPSAPLREEADAIGATPQR